MSNWYYLKNSQRYGPVTRERLTTLLHAGELAEDTMVWTGGMNSWRPFRESPGPPSQGAPLESKAHCSACGRTGPLTVFTPTASGRLCGNCAPSNSAKPFAISTRYAGFWIRALATVADSLILAIPAYLISMIQTALLGTSGGDMVLILIGALYSISANIAVGLAYEVYFLGTYSATPGKMLLNLKVQTASGGRISYVRALGRFAAQILSAIPFGIGYLMAGIDREKRALHDHICNTRVVHTDTPYRRSGSHRPPPLSVQ